MTATRLGAGRTAPPGRPIVDYDLGNDRTAAGTRDYRGTLDPS